MGKKKSTSAKAPTLGELMPTPQELAAPVVISDDDKALVMRGLASLVRAGSFTFRTGSLLMAIEELHRGTLKHPDAFEVLEELAPVLRLRGWAVSFAPAGYTGMQATLTPIEENDK